jgi:hypothetical protein
MKTELPSSFSCKIDILRVVPFLQNRGDRIQFDLFYTLRNISLTLRFSLPSLWFPTILVHICVASSEMGCRDGRLGAGRSGLRIKGALRK